MLNALTMKALNATHRAVLRMTGGRIGWTAGGMPVLELTTTGRRSGQPRRSLLTSPVQEGQVYVVVGSRGGDDEHPAWYLNLREQPNVQVALAGGPPRAMYARVATPAERERLWPKIVARYPGYERYRRKTSREIPIVLLGPPDR